jgi:alpha-beta hydrolase superfamily lysophospholipase
MERITAPMLFITGDRDFVNADRVRSSGYEGVSSAVKEFICFAGYGHTDLVMGKRVQSEVYPVIADWLESIPA